MLPLWQNFAYKPHQEFGVKWMIGQESQTPAGGILCDEMGLGKTIEMLGLMKADATSTHTLLLAPVAVLSQWEETAYRAGITVFKPVVTTRHISWESTGNHGPNAPNLYIIGYEAARAKQQLVTMHAWDRIICDEAHRVGSGKGLFNVVQHIPTKIRWFLTATPIVNKLKDLQHLFILLGIEEATSLNSIETLTPLIKKYVLARSMEQLRASIPDAPPKPETITMSLPFDTAEEAEFYRGISGVIVRRWKALAADGDALLKLKLFMKLRQLSLHPQVYIQARRNAIGAAYERPDWHESSTKFEAIKDLVKKNPGHKWIIFCHFHPEMMLLSEALKGQSWIRNVDVYNGTLSHPERKAMLDSTLVPLDTSDKSDVLLVQLQSGGVGLNLQHFDRIIFSGPWWTSALMEQAVGRAVRIGQKEVVKIYHLKLKEEEALNIDSVMMEKAEAKGDLCRAVLNTACRDVKEKPKVKFSIRPSVRVTAPPSSVATQ
jgi:SNF2 family DNA or RNA helicase